MSDFYTYPGPPSERKNPMSNQPKTAADLPVGREDLEMWQERIEEAQITLRETLEEMIEALDQGTPIGTELYREAEEQTCIITR
jgi:hypothetical protein